MFNSLNKSKSNNKNYLTLEQNKYVANSIEIFLNFTNKMKKTFKIKQLENSFDYTNFFFFFYYKNKT